MITIVLTYRDRDLNIAKKCLDSLKHQSLNSFEVFLVNYGSNLSFSDKIQELSKNYSFVKLIDCPVEGQLWNKCRAINIALKQCTTPYFLVGDIDLIFHPNFVQILNDKASDKVLYFQYGFLSKQESSETKEFQDYKIDFLGSDEVTGTTLFPTDILKKVNGYDEFYHGWGAEDTDIHLRLKNFGLAVEFYNEEVLVKHQWHPKAYRSKLSSKPFHSKLERINHNYMMLSEKNKRIYANLNMDWGLMPIKEAYSKLLLKPDLDISISNNELQFNALLAQFKNFTNEVVKIKIIKASFNENSIQQLKKILNKKHISFVSMESLNNQLLETIIKNYRNLPYNYNFDRKASEINLTICFK